MSRAHRWPGEDHPLAGVHGGTKEAAKRAIAESPLRVALKPRRVSKSTEQRERAVAIAQAQLEQLLSKLPPIPTPRHVAERVDRVRPKRLPDRLRERREWLKAHIDAQSGRCAYCRVPLQRTPIECEAWRKPSLDHVVPLSAGGPDSFDNTVAACQGCNNAKGSLSKEEFMAQFRSLRLRIGLPA